MENRILVEERVEIRPGCEADAPRLMEIYNHYVVHTPVTFDIEAVDLANRLAWMSGYREDGPYRLLCAVARETGRLLGYATSSPLKARAAYDTSIEVSVYLAPEAIGQGIGHYLYQSLFAAIRDEPLHRAYAGVTMPNQASVALHQRFGFQQVGLFREVGWKFERYWDVGWWEKAL